MKTLDEAITAFHNDNRDTFGKWKDLQKEVMASPLATEICVDLVSIGLRENPAATPSLIFFTGICIGVEMERGEWQEEEKTA